MVKIGCIGFGAMGSSLVSGFIHTGVNPGDILVYDLAKKAREKALANGLVVIDSLDELVLCDLILLAVKPQNLDTVANKWIFKDKMIISILAGITIEQLTQVLGNQKIVRIMPNLPVQIGKGVLALHFSEAIVPDEKDMLRNLLSECGSLFELEEKYFNAVTALSGSGPAFILLFLEALAMGGVLEGLEAKTALEMATKTMLGTAEYLLTQKQHPACLRDLVTSPAGTTAAGLLVLEENGVRAAIIKAVKAAAKRGEELSEGK